MKTFTFSTGTHGRPTVVAAFKQAPAISKIASRNLFFLATQHARTPHFCERNSY
jgi:hypothetical protein